MKTFLLSKSSTGEKFTTKAKNWSELEGKLSLGSKGSTMLKSRFYNEYMACVAGVGAYLENSGKWDLAKSI
tara:strand:- start:24106 stop:24318 length:213 start_codon:yes stop_codon:yes gene_type:complete